jgi:DNA-binding transcriptional LysR family regulator
MDRLQALRLFAATVEHGSLAAAARAAGVSLATVSRSLARLERELGARLLARTTRSLSLTPGGRAYYQRAKRIVEELAEADALLARESTEPAGRLTVSAPTLFGRQFVAPAVADFLLRHPKLDVRLMLTDRYLDLVEEGIDVAVRTGRLEDSSLVARRVGVYRRMVVAAPAYLQRAGTPRRPSDLERHNCLVLSTQRAPHDWNFYTARGITSVAVSGNWETNDNDALLAAALAGHGLARMPSWQAEPHLAAGRLLAVLANYTLPEIPIQVVFASARLLPARVRAFSEFLAARWEKEKFIGVAPKRAR